MPNFTNNYNLKKPLKTERYNIDDHNDNMDILDGIINTHLVETQSQFNQAVGAVTVDSEVVLARDGKTTLKERLDNEKEDFIQHKLDYVELKNIKDEAVTTTKRTVSGDYAHCSIHLPVDFDLVNKVIKFPNTTSGIIYYRNKRIDVPSGLQLPINESSGYSALMLNTKTKEFKTFPYGSFNGVTVTEDWVILASMNGANVVCDFPFTINGKEKIIPRNQVNMLNTGSTMVMYSPIQYPITIKKNGYNVEIEIIDNIWIYPHEKNEALSFGSSGVSNYSLPINSYDSETQKYKFTIQSGYSLLGNWIDKTVRVAYYTDFKNGDFLLAGCYQGKLQAGLFKDINNDKQIEDLYSKVGIGSNGLKDYVEEELRNKSIAHTKKSGVLSFAYLTDVHDHKIYRREYKFNMLNYLAKKGLVDFVVNGGDTLGYDTKEEVLIKLMDYNNIITNGIKIPYIFCKGNHDSTGGIHSPEDTKNILNDVEWYNTIKGLIDPTAIQDKNNPYGGYYYKDFDHAKIRVINLNTSQIDVGTYYDPMDVLIQQSQIDWLQNIALKFDDKGVDKSNWGVVILSHASINNLDGGGLNGKLVIEGILKSFMEGSTYTGTQGTGIFKVDGNSNFTDQGSMEFICSVNGHMHYDRSINFTSLNRPAISVGCGKTEKWTEDYDDVVIPERTAGTITEELMDIFTIDRLNRKIKTTRIGAGSDREISY